MPVTADSYEAQAVERGIAMLANSSTFQALVGAANATQAKAKIIESWGGNPGRTGGKGKATATDGTQFTLTAPFAVVHQSELDTELGGVASIDYAGSIGIALHLARVTSTDSPPETFRRGRNTIGAIRAELQALFGGANYLATGTARSAGPTLPEDSGADGAELIGEIILDWTA